MGVRDKLRERLLSDLAKADEGAAILRRLVPAPRRGPGWRCDPKTGLFYYSARWLDGEVRQ